MYIEIVIKGGQELSEFYPKKYKVFEKKLIKLTEMFPYPGVDGLGISPQLTDHHQNEKDEREKLRDKRYEQEILRALDDPEVRKMIRGIREEKDES
jgi:hypothetical protein